MADAVDPRRLPDDELITRIRDVQARLHTSEKAIAEGRPDMSRGEMRGLMSDCNLMLVEARKRGLRIR